MQLSAFKRSKGSVTFTIIAYDKSPKPGECHTCMSNSIFLTLLRFLVMTQVFSIKKTITKFTTYVKIIHLNLSPIFLEADGIQTLSGLLHN